MSDIERKHGDDTSRIESRDVDADIEKAVSNFESGDNTNAEGTAHQDAAGSKPTRAHFFSPLDRGYADAVNEDAKAVVYTEEEDYKVKRKIDNSVLPLVICSYICGSQVIMRIDERQKY
ncbi:hypothetical protein PQX77_014589 [Marasmius sp. AFHP31]|nr:hypothetical protein PQX77_014589 [Marasmius sp. AFHP31]